MTAAYRFELRRGTAAAWTAANPILLLGEPGFETDTRQFKFGDGATPWTGLSYGTAPGISSNTAAIVAEAATARAAEATNAAGIATEATNRAAGDATTTGKAAAFALIFGG